MTAPQRIWTMDGPAPMGYGVMSGGSFAWLFWIAVGLGVVVWVAVRLALALGATREARVTLAAGPETITPSAHQEPKSSVLARLAAGIGGLLVLSCAALVSFGTVVLALIGMAVVAGVQRRRGRALTRSGHWVTACSTMAVVALGSRFQYVNRGGTCRKSPGGAQTVRLRRS